MIHKPGPGWQHLAGSAWAHRLGLRLHMLGTARLPSGEYVHADTYPESIRANRAIRIAGSRKRGLMIWALWLASEKDRIKT